MENRGQACIHLLHLATQKKSACEDLQQPSVKAGGHCFSAIGEALCQCSLHSERHISPYVEGGTAVTEAVKGYQQRSSQQDSRSRVQEPQDLLMGGGEPCETWLRAARM